MASEEEMYVVSWPPDDMITIIKIILLLLLLTTTTVRVHGPKRRMIVFFRNLLIARWNGFLWMWTSDWFNLNRGYDNYYWAFRYFKRPKNQFIILSCGGVSNFGWARRDKIMSGGKFYAIMNGFISMIVFFGGIIKARTDDRYWLSEQRKKDGLHTFTCTHWLDCWLYGCPWLLAVIVGIYFSSPGDPCNCIPFRAWEQHRIIINCP